jgi:hypothetical protein
MAEEKLPDDILWHQSGVNQKGEPFVQLIRGEEVIAQMSVEQARDHARAITEAAEAAETDAFIFQWVLHKAGAGPEQAVGLLADFRKYRAEVTGKREGATSPTDWVMPKPKPKSDGGDFTKKNP